MDHVSCFCQILKLMFSFVFQWLFRGLVRSTEDHICSAGGQVLREPDWLWQSFGWSKERLDQPCDQQVRPGSVLRPSVRRNPGHTHTHNYCCLFSMHATYCVALEYSNAEYLVFVPSQRPSCWRGLPEHWPVGPTSVKGKHHMCTIGTCPPLQGDADVMRAVMFLNAT